MSRLLPADGRVAVAVATTGADAEACLAQTRAAAAAGADVVELRADLLLAGPGPRTSPAPRSEGASRPEDPSRLEGPGWPGAPDRVGDVVGLVGDVVNEAGGTPVLLTVRTVAEGGGARLDDAAYSDLLHRLIEGLAELGAARRPTALDVEQARGGTAGLVARAHGAGLDVVVSHHDLRATPADEAMLARLRAMADAGADVAKLAVMPSGPRDVARLLGVTARAGEELDVAVATMSMGPLGAVSRLSGAVFGSVLTFATAGGAPSAPGQLPIDRVRAVLDLLPPLPRDRP